MNHSCRCLVPVLRTSSAKSLLSSVTIELVVSSKKWTLQVALQFDKTFVCYRGCSAKYFVNTPTGSFMKEEPWKSGVYGQ